MVQGLTMQQNSEEGPPRVPRRSLKDCAWGTADTAISVSSPVSTHQTQRQTVLTLSIFPVDFPALPVGFLGASVETVGMFLPVYVPQARLRSWLWLLVYRLDIHHHEVLKFDLKHV
jgi:hypothetical protein